MDDIALYTCAAWPELWADDQLLLPALQRAGLRGAPQRWDQPATHPFRAGLLRSTWDYFLRLPEFLAFLEAAPPALFNPLALLRWNLDKRYLLALAERGVAIVPTRYRETVSAADLPALWQEFGEIILKPTVSAGSWRTVRLAPGAALPSGPVGHSKGALPGAPEPEPPGFLIQPFLPQITEGEWSLVFFDGVYSHALRKHPQAGDFRVQEQYGGRNEAAEPPPWMIAQAQAVLTLLPSLVPGAEPPLYARVDGVASATERDQLLLMELELIEPVLYLRQAPGAADRLAQALRRRLALSR